MLTPEQFGAKGDGRNDDAPALQAAFDRAQGAGVRLRPARYRIARTVLLPTDAMIAGEGATLLAAFDDRPIVATRSWAGRGPTLGRLHLSNLRIVGTGRGAGQDGLVVHDYWSDLDGIDITTTGGRGIVLDARTSRGDEPTGTLVETTLRNCRVREARGTAFWLGASGNRKLTDGRLANCIASLAEGSVATCVHIGHAAGWTIEGLHTYGGAPARALDLHNAYFTSLSNIYIETFREAAIALEGLQTTASLANVHVRCEEADPGAAFLAVSGHGAFEGSALLLSNVALWHAGRKPVRAVARSGKQVRIAASSLVVAGPGARLVEGADTLVTERFVLPLAPPPELAPRPR